IFHFNFCCNGEWMSVVIDDLLPTVGGRLIFGHSSTRNEYWLALLEKAYAKLNGSYEALSYGSACEAFVDFTGGVPEVIKLNEYDRNNPQHIMGRKRQNYPNGLIVMHEYGVITMNRIRYNGKLVNLVRLRNPWGKTVQWNGAWSSNSAEWKSIPEKIRQKADLKLEDVGEFWMDFADFVENFTTIECCHILHGSEKHDWIPFHFNSEWDAKNCGGCHNHKDTFPMNPKFLLTVSKKDVDIDDDLCTVLISLTQLSYRYRKMRFKNIIRIGFIIYFYENLTEQETNDGKPDVKDVGPNFVNHEFFHHNLSVAHCDFVDKRNNGLRLRFPPAKYIIVPSTFDPGQVWPFMLRILVSRSKEDRKEYERENKAKDIDLEEINRQLHRHQHQHKGNINRKRSHD
ncbi:Calpain-1 catalytic subunit, partial [Blomia tropicalis]